MLVLRQLPSFLLNKFQLLLKSFISCGWQFQAWLWAWVKDVCKNILCFPFILVTGKIPVQFMTRFIDREPLCLAPTWIFLQWKWEAPLRRAEYVGAVNDEIIRQTDQKTTHPIGLLPFGRHHLCVNVLDRVVHWRGSISKFRCENQKFSKSIFLLIAIEIVNDGAGRLVWNVTFA